MYAPGLIETALLKGLGSVKAGRVSELREIPSDGSIAGLSPLDPDGKRSAMVG